MTGEPLPLRLQHLVPSRVSEDRRTNLLRWLGAITIHSVPAALLLSALPLKPHDAVGAFGQSVSVTLVSGAPKPAGAAQPRSSDLSSLTQRLSEPGLTDLEPPSTSTPATSSSQTRLSDLFDQPNGTSGRSPVKGPPLLAAGADDDPFARASVSYRGNDPTKTARLQAQVQGCAGSGKTLRLLIIINAEGNLVAKPRPLNATASDAKAAKAVTATERCAPFTNAATPGPPRSYEIDLG